MRREISALLRMALCGLLLASLLLACGPTENNGNANNDNANENQNNNENTNNYNNNTEPECGNATVEDGEDCDCGTDTVLVPVGCVSENSDTEPDACRTDCTDPACGDGVVDSGEQCDDGGISPGDGCDEACQLEIDTVEVLLIGDNTMSQRRVSMFDPYDGDYLGEFLYPTNPTEDGYAFYTPLCTAQLPTGEILVSDQVEDTIFMFSTLGEYLGDFAVPADGLDNIRGIAVFNNVVFVAESGSNVIATFDLSGNRLTDYVDDGSDPFDIHFVAGDGRMFLTDITGDALWIYPAGGGTGVALLPMNFAQQVNDADGNYLVAAWGDDEVHEVTPAGDVVRSHSIRAPRGVYLLGNGNWLVTSGGTSTTMPAEGVIEINPSDGSLVDTKELCISYRMIERIQVAGSLVP